MRMGHPELNNLKRMQFMVQYWDSVGQTILTLHLNFYLFPYYISIFICSFKGLNHSYL